MCDSQYFFVKSIYFFCQIAIIHDVFFFQGCHHQFQRGSQSAFWIYKSAQLRGMNYFKIQLGYEKSAVRFWALGVIWPLSIGLQANQKRILSSFLAVVLLECTGSNAEILIHRIKSYLEFAKKNWKSFPFTIPFSSCSWFITFCVCLRFYYRTMY